MLKIDETNYEGYLELYKILPSFRLKAVFKAISYLVLYLLLTRITLLFTNKVVMASVFMFSLPPLLFKTYDTLKKDKIKWKKELKEKYPYININIDGEELINALIDSKIINKTENNEYIIDPNYKEKQEYLKKCNQILKEIKKEDRFNPNYDDIKENPKIKVKKYERSRLPKKIL